VVGRPAAAAISLRRHLPGELFDRLYFGSLMRQITREPADQARSAPVPQSQEDMNLYV
jgi:hypothetical protein